MMQFIFSDTDLLKNSDFNLDPNNTQVFTGPPPFALDPVSYIKRSMKLVYSIC